MDNSFESEEKDRSPDLYGDLSPEAKDSASKPKPDDDEDRNGDSDSRPRSRSRRKSVDRSVSRSRSRSADRSRERRVAGGRGRPEPDHSVGNYGPAGGNNDPNVPVIDVTRKFGATCHFWKMSNCYRGAEKCSYIHGFICRDEIHCARPHCNEIHIKQRKPSGYVSICFMFLFINLFFVLEIHEA